MEFSVLFHALIKFNHLFSTQFIFFWGIDSFFLIIDFMCVELFVVFPYYPLDSVGSVVMSLVSFPIICFFFQFLFVNITRGLSIALIFSMNQFLFHWFSLLFFCFQFYWLLFKSLLLPSFYLLWFYSDYLFLGWLSRSLVYCCYFSAINFPWSMALVVSCIMLHFHFYSINLYLEMWYHQILCIENSLTHYLFECIMLFPSVWRFLFPFSY